MAYIYSVLLSLLPDTEYSMPGPYEKFETAFEAFQEQLRQEIHDQFAAFREELLNQIQSPLVAEEETDAPRIDLTGLKEILPEIKVSSLQQTLPKANLKQSAKVIEADRATTKKMVGAP